MIENTAIQLDGRDAIDCQLTLLLREGARRLIEHAVEAELQDLLARQSIAVPKAAEPVAFRSLLVPPYVRKMKSLEAGANNG